jgi:hypothetical protein
VANNFPSLPPMSVANVQYFIHMTPVSVGSSSTPQQAVALVNFGFERVDPGTGNVTFDYSGFDQDTYEAGLKVMLGGICTQWAANLGTVKAVVQAAMTVERTWTFNGSPGFVMSDFMAYP